MRKKLRPTLKIRIFLAALLVASLTVKLTTGTIEESWEGSFYMALLTFVIVVDVSVAAYQALAPPIAEEVQDDG